MKLSKNGRKTQKAIRRALMLGLPVAGLLLTAGCDRPAPKAKEPNAKELKEETSTPYRTEDEISRLPGSGKPEGVKDCKLFEK